MGSVARVAIIVVASAAVLGTVGVIYHPARVISPTSELEDLALTVFDDKGRQIAIGSINRDGGKVEVRLREGKLRAPVNTTPGEVGIRR